MPFVRMVSFSVVKVDKVFLVTVSAAVKPSFVPTEKATVCFDEGHGLHLLLVAFAAGLWGRGSGRVQRSWCLTTPW